MASLGKVVHSPPKSKSSDDTFATPTITPELEETSLPGTLGGDIQCGQNPLADQETSKLEGPMATSTQKPDNPRSPVSLIRFEIIQIILTKWSSMTEVGEAPLRLTSTKYQERHRPPLLRNKKGRNLKIYGTQSSRM